MRQVVLCIATLMGLTTAHAAQPASLCSADEQVVFSCSLTNKKIVSLCASKPLTAAIGYVQYRYGTDKSLELQFPAKRELPKDHFFYSSVMYSGGGASAVRFQIGEFEYFVYDQAIRTNFKAGETNRPALESGVITRQEGKRAVVRRCAVQASIQEAAYQQFEHEEFDDSAMP